MRFALTAEQQALAEMAGDVFAKWYPPGRLRELFDGAAPDPLAWRAVAEVGLVGVAIGEADGGSGGDAVDLVVVAEQAGRACLPEPWVEAAAVAPVTLTTTPAREWLPRIAAGDVTVAVQLEPDGVVAHAATADVLLVQADDGMHLVERSGFVAEPVDSEDATRRLSRVRLTEELGPVVGDARAAVRHGALATAAMLNGVAGALLDMTVDYVKVRRQFGVPVGSFQAVKHKLASVHAALESSRAATRYAAYAVARGMDDAHYAVQAAKAHAVEAEGLANTEALQCHAGIGFTWEHDLHLWLKRGRALEHAYGSLSQHRAALAAALLDG